MGVGLKPNTITFNATITTCERSSRWQHALHLFDCMTGQSVQRDVVTFNAAISGCVLDATKRMRNQGANVVRRLMHENKSAKERRHKKNAKAKKAKKPKFAKWLSKKKGKKLLKKKAEKKKKKKIELGRKKKFGKKRLVGPAPAGPAKKEARMHIGKDERAAK